MTTPLDVRTVVAHQSLSSWRRAARLIVLHFAPGVVILAGFAMTAPVLQRHGLPPIWGLLTAVLVVMVPLGALVERSRRRGQFIRAGWRRSLDRSERRLTLFALVTSLLVPGLLLPLEEPIRAGLLPGAPTWFSAGLGQLTAYSESMQVATLALWFVAVVIVGPIVEEVYFRGYLLGELPGSALTRSLLGSVMFSLYHLWQPQAFLTMVATSLPLYWVVIRSGRLMPAVIAHVGANTLMFALLSFGVLSR